MREWIRNHPKITTTIGVAAGAAAAYYGVPPEYSQPVLHFICDLWQLCPPVS